MTCNNKTPKDYNARYRKIDSVFTGGVGAAALRGCLSWVCAMRMDKMQSVVTYFRLASAVLPP